MKFSMIFEAQVEFGTPDVERQAIRNCVEQAVFAEQMGFAKVFAVAKFYESAAALCDKEKPERVKALLYVAAFLRNPRTHDFLSGWFPNHPAVLR